MSQFTFTDRLMPGDAIYVVLPNHVARLEADASGAIKYRSWRSEQPFEIVPAKTVRTLRPGHYEVAGSGTFRMTTGTVRSDDRE
jgi:hypothetical protein